MNTIRNLFCASLVGLGFLTSSSLGQTQTSMTTTESQAIAAAVIAEAEANAAASPSAGHDDKGFFIAGANGFRLNVGGDLQFRYTTSFNDGVSGYNGGFNTPLTRLRFSGSLSDPITFMLEADFNRTDGTATLKDAYAGIDALGGNWRFGQFKLPFLREQLVSDRYQLAADRSVVAYIFSQDRSQGVQATYDFNNFRAMLAFSDGFKTANTDFNDPRESDYAVTGRLEWLVSGDRKTFTDFTSSKGDNSSLLLGGAFHFQDGTSQHRMYAYTGDVSYKNNGFGAYAAGVGRNTEEGTASYNDYGAVGQVSYRVSERVEPFARYDAVFASSDRNLSRDNFNFVTGGVNYYIAGQSVKFTADAVWALNDTTGLSSLGNFSNTGLVPTMKENNVALRLQFQVLF